MSLKDWQNFTTQTIELSSDFGGSFESYTLAVVRLHTAQRALITASFDSPDKDALYDLADQISQKIREISHKREEYEREYLACLD